MFLGLLWNSTAYGNEINVKCIELSGKGKWTLAFNLKNQTWSTSKQSNMAGKLIKNNFYFNFEFPEGASNTVAKIKFNIPSKRLYVDYYDMVKEELMNMMVLSYSQYMTKNQIMDVNEINKHEGAYIMYEAVKDNFKPSVKEVYKCDDVKKASDSNQNSGLPDIIIFAENVRGAQLLEFFLEAVHILKKGKLHLKKCLDEYNLYNNLNGEFCSTLHASMKNLYIPTEKAIKLVRPEVKRQMDKHMDSNDKPSWWIELDDELAPFTEVMNEYMKYQNEVLALFAAANKS